MRTLYIVGAGGFGREVEWASNTDYWWSYGRKVFCVEPGYKDKSQLPCVELDYNLPLNKGDMFVIAIGNPAIRKRIAEKWLKLGTIDRIRERTVISGPRVDISRCGTILCAGSILTCDIKVGDFTIINIGCMIGHDVKIGNFVTLSPSCNLMGNVTIEDEVELGTAVTVIPGVTIGKGSVIGAGAVVTKNIPPYSVAVGVPAKVIKNVEPSSNDNN